jgi:hypothetical protein
MINLEELLVKACDNAGINKSLRETVLELVALRGE